MRRAYAYGLPAAAILVAVALRLAAPGFADRLSDFWFDALQRAVPRPAIADLPIHVVDIDEASLAAYGQWPWPRTLVAELVRDLSDAGARVIGFDILFAEPDRSSPRIYLKTIERGGMVPEETRTFLARAPDNDSILAAAVGAAPVVVGEVLTAENGPVPPAKAGIAVAGPQASLRMVSAHGGAIAPLAAILKSAAGLGFLNHEPDWDRVVRRVPLLLRAGDKLHPSFAAELLRVAVGAKGYIVKTAGANGEADFGFADGIVAVRIGGATVPTDATGSVWLHYTSPAAAAAPRISAKDVLDGNFDRLRVKGSIVIVGSTFAGNNDLVATPVSAAMGGVDVHAQLVEQILQGWFLDRPDWSTGIELAFAITAGLALIVIIPHLGALAGALIALSTLAAAATGSFLAFREAHLLIDVVYPGLVIAAIYVLATLIGFLRTEAERRQVRGAFSRYMSPALVEELARNPERLVLGGEIRTMTLMFCDIRGFTTISEGLSAQELTHFINRFLSPMTEIILDHKGTIDKYIGDCVMAFWNAPLDDPDHARNAVSAAQAMRRRLAELNAEWAKEAEFTGRPFKPVKIGIGINTGECCVGNMGSDQRFDYSVLGDAVNLASRLEGLGKTYGVDLVLGETTGEMLRDWPLIELDLVAVKGKSKAVRIHTLLPGAEPAAAIPGVETHTRLLDAYRTQDWAAAIGLVESALTGTAKELSAVYALYRHRIEEFMESPPPANWDGVYVAKEK